MLCVSLSAEWRWQYGSFNVTGLKTDLSERKTRIKIHFASINRNPTERARTPHKNSNFWAANGDGWLDLVVRSFSISLSCWTLADAFYSKFSFTQMIWKIISLHYDDATRLPQPRNSLLLASVYTKKKKRERERKRFNSFWNAIRFRIHLIRIYTSRECVKPNSPNKRMNGIFKVAT